MNQTIYVDKPDATMQGIISAGAPRYNGKKITIHICDPDQVHNLNSYWDSGYRDYFSFVRMADMKAMPIEQNGTPFDGKNYSSKIPDGFALVCHSYNGSARNSLSITVNSNNAAGLLPAPKEGLTEDEQIVLYFTSCLKPSYAGIKNFRFHEANRAKGITLDRWESAKQSCIAQKLLNAAGAITAEGRNAIANLKMSRY